MAVFVQGDTRKALRVYIRDDNNQPLDLTGGEARLLARGQTTLDQPTSNPDEIQYNGVLGVIVDAQNGICQFEGLGGLVNIDPHASDIYDYQVRFTSAAPSRVSYSWPLQTFEVRMPLA